MYVCVNTYRHMQPDVKAVIPICLNMIDHADPNPSSMHACEGNPFMYACMSACAHAWMVGYT